MMRMILWAIAALALLGVVQPAAAASQPYIGERMIFAGTFCPAGWEQLEGQLMQVVGNEILFNLIGTTYGGDGQQTFALPNTKPIFSANGGPNGQNNVPVRQCIATQGIFPSQP